MLALRASSKCFIEQNQDSRTLMIHAMHKASGQTTAPSHHRHDARSALYRLLLIGFLVRIVMIVVGEVLDGQWQLKYTDVDYHVFSDGARYVTKRMSPYERATYRYSPLLAVLMVPNVLWLPAMGKILFSLADIALAWAIYHIQLHQDESVQKALGAAKVCLFWYLHAIHIRNPMVVVLLRPSYGSIIR